MLETMSSGSEYGAVSSGKGFQLLYVLTTYNCLKFSSETIDEPCENASLFTILKLNLKPVKHG